MPNFDKEKKYYGLAEKWLNATITPEEEAAFFDWYNKDQDFPLTIPEATAKDEQTLKIKLWQAIESKRTPSNNKKGILQYLNVRRVAAAIIFLVAGSAVYFLLNPTKTNSSIASLQANKTEKTTLLPGGNKATLTLANGKVITLDDAVNGTISTQTNTKIIKLKSGLLSYQTSNSATNALASINVLTTPKGGQYQVELPDGSIVWLNAASSLKYPTFFSGNERVVELSGEAYFEVAKNKDMPFKVKVNDMEVAVLGTHFNVMAYNDESTVYTTLLEGSVRINTPQSGITIVPGEQARFSTNSKIKVVDADVDEAVAWKNGFFQFNSADMQTVIKQLSRWYDVNIVCDKKIDEHFTGTISRNVEADKVFKMLQSTGAIKIDVKNKQVLITK